MCSSLRAQTIRGGGADDLHYLVHHRLTTIEVHAAHDLDGLCRMWQLSWSLRQGPQRSIVNAVLTAAIRMHVPLAPKCFLRVSAPWLPHGLHTAYLHWLCQCIKSANLHPIITMFYCEHISIATRMWPSLLTLLCNVHAKRKLLTLQSEAVPCTCFEFRLVMAAAGWEPPPARQNSEF